MHCGGAGMSCCYAVCQHPSPRVGLHARAWTGSSRSLLERESKDSAHSRAVRPGASSLSLTTLVQTPPEPRRVCMCHMVLTLLFIQHLS